MESKYSNLDLLRSFAVLSVATAHLEEQLVVFKVIRAYPLLDQLLRNMSFTGVMFFFVHTCLVLMMSMHRSPPQHFGRNFLIRRAFRIVPLCWAVIVLALITGLTDEPAGTLQALGWRGVVVNLLLVHNIFRGHVSVIGPLWSLDWEMQMYLLLPVFFIFLRRHSRVRVTIVVWATSAIVAVIATLPGVPRPFHAAVFPPMFIAGMVAYKLLLNRSAWSRSASLPASLWPFFLLALFVAQSLLNGRRAYESSAGIALDACICFVLALAIPNFREITSPWIVNAAENIAKYSYGIYLLHIPALIFILRYAPHLSPLAIVFSYVALTGLLSVGAFHLLEDPLIRIGKRLVRAPNAIAARPFPAEIDPVLSTPATVSAEES